jgi:hypothetical protein
VPHPTTWPSASYSSAAAVSVTAIDEPASPQPYQDPWAGACAGELVGRADGAPDRATELHRGPGPARRVAPRGCLGARGLAGPGRALGPAGTLL